MRSTTILLNLFLIVGTVFGQSLSIGVVGGTHLTDGIAGGSFLPVEPGSHSIVGGAMIELNLTGRLSLELDGLYRGLRGRYRTGSSPFTIVTWNMPLLSKYRLAGADARIAPFIAAGPSLRFGVSARAYEPPLAAA